MTKFDQIQAARDTRLAKLQRGAWNVVKVNDDGRTIIVERNVTPHVAERLAGERRDSMPDADVGDGWTFLAQRAEALRAVVAGQRPRANEYA